MSQPRELAVYHQPDNQARCAGRDHRAIDSTVRNHAHITSFKDHSRATMCTVEQAVEPTYRCALYSGRDNFHVRDTSVKFPTFYILGYRHKSVLTHLQQIPTLKNWNGIYLNSLKNMTTL